MRYFILTLLFVSTLFASKADDQLMLAYQKEFSFLKAQKKSLKLQLRKIEYRHKVALKKAKDDVENRQNTLLGYNIKAEKIQEKLHKLELNKDDSDNDSALTEAVLMQMKSSLKSYGRVLTENKDALITLKNGFTQTKKRLVELEKITRKTGHFYLEDGSRVKGEIIHVGNIAAFGLSETINSALAPAGDGKLKVWPNTLS